MRILEELGADKILSGDGGSGIRGGYEVGLRTHEEIIDGYLERTGVYSQGTTI